jgi:hypothetical protein
MLGSYRPGPSSPPRSLPGVSDLGGGSTPAPGATIVYTLVVT